MGRIMLVLVPLILMWDTELIDGNLTLFMILHTLRIRVLIFGGNKKATVGLH